MSSVHSNAQYIPVARGSLHYHSPFPSQFIDPRPIVVWLPEGYSEDQNYPVLYMHDGQMLFSFTVTKDQDDWGVDQEIDMLIRLGTISDVIVVGIFNHVSLRSLEYLPQKPLKALKEKEIAILTEHPDPFLPEIPNSQLLADDYLRFLVYELKPFIDRTYATRPDRQNTFIAGSSMGGLISWYAQCEYPNVFGGAACLSTHWTGLFRTENNPIPGRFLDYLRKNLPPPDTHRFYFDHGTEDLDTLYGPFQVQADQIGKEKGYTADTWLSNVFPGTGHVETDWRVRLHIPLTFFFHND